MAVESRKLYIFVGALVLLLAGLLGWVSADPFSGTPWWAYAAGALGVLLLAYGLWDAWSEIRGGLGRRSTRTALQVAAMIVIVVGIQTVVELFSVKHYTRWDVTPGEFFSLSQKTQQILEKLDKEKRRIEFLAFIQKTRRPAVKEVLEQYVHRSKQVSLRFIDLDASPRLAKKYDVDLDGTIVVVHRFKKEEAAKKEEARKAAEAEKEEGATKKGEGAAKAEKKAAPKNFRSEKIFSLAENAIANAILKAVQTEQKKVYFLTGHGERLHKGSGREVLSALANSMRDDNYEVDELLLLRKKGVPEGTNILVIAAPRADLAEAEIGFLDDYIRRGGKLLVLLEPETQGRILDFLSRFGVESPESIVLDPQAVRFELVGGNVVTPFVADYGVHEITEKLRGMATVFPTVRRVSAKNDPKRGISAEILARTGKGSFTVTGVTLKDGKLSYDPKEKKDGPVPLAAALTVSLDQFFPDGAKGEKGKKPAAQAKKGAEARIVVFGDADFASDAFIRAQGNANLALNAVNWLGGEKALISIRPKRRIGSPLVIQGGETNFVRLATVVLMPLLVLLVGLTVYIQRRRLR
ncbi:MAG: Gldg family protein [bacterium]